MPFPSPKTTYQSLIDVGKFNMMWNVSSVLAFVFVLLTFVHLYFQDSSWMTSVLSLSAVIFNLVILYRTRKFFGIAVFSVFVGVLVCQASIFLIEESHLITNVIWSLLVGVFGFFLFGYWMGFFLMLLNVGGLLIYLRFGDSEAIQHKLQISFRVDTQTLVHVLIVTLAFSFIVSKMIRNIREVNYKFERENKRNELLLKEIHHRVKNNLQIISSLLNLQAQDSNEPEVREHFTEAIGRIRSMALIHEKMYNNDDLAQIDIHSYLLSLIQDIISSIQSQCSVELTVDSDVEKIDIKSVVPISLLFNELITNSIKHGFSDMGHGIIEVRIASKGEWLTIYYHDNGKWIADESKDGFGLELIKTLTDQLEGDVERSIQNGTSYSFRFKKARILFNDKD